MVTILSRASTVKCQKSSWNILYELLFCFVPTLETPYGKEKVLHYRQFFIIKIDSKGYFYLRKIFVAPLLVIYGMVARGLKC